MNAEWRADSLTAEFTYVARVTRYPSKAGLQKAVEILSKIETGRAAAHYPVLLAIESALAEGAAKQVEVDGEQRDVVSNTELFERLDHFFGVDGRPDTPYFSPIYLPGGRNSFHWRTKGIVAQNTMTIAKHTGYVHPAVSLGDGEKGYPLLELDDWRKAVCKAISSRDEATGTETAVDQAAFGVWLARQAGLESATETPSVADLEGAALEELGLSAGKDLLAVEPSFFSPNSDYQPAAEDFQDGPLSPTDVLEVALSLEPPPEDPQETEAVEVTVPDEDWLARRYAEWLKESGYPTFEDRQHLEYRHIFADALAEEKLASGDLDVDLFKKLSVKWYGGPGSQSYLMRFLKDHPDTGPSRLAETIHYLLYGDGEVADRITAVLEAPEYKISGFGEAMATKCLAVVHPDKWLPLFVYHSYSGSGKADFLKLLEIGFEPDGKSLGELAEQSNDRLRQRTEPLEPHDPWAQSSFLWWLKGQGVSSQTLADELLIDQWWLDEIQSLIQDKPQIIFYGPPGTGKTYVAKRLAETMVGEANMRIVQFHPSYAYEDFVQGYRPTEGNEGGGNVSFALQDGPLMELANKAADSGEQCVILIDEINRANIAKVFGELYFLLEYRGEKIRLQYGDDYSLPDNLVFVGTMNTADRSIALLDAALRRRFNFVPFFPDEEPIKGLLARWLKRNRPDMLFVADVVDEANAELEDRNLQIGPSHFMRESLDQTSLERIWRFSIIPYIQEHFFDDPDRVEDFELATLIARVKDKQGKPAPPAEVEPAYEEEAANGADDTAAAG